MKNIFFIVMFSFVVFALSSCAGADASGIAQEVLTTKGTVVHRVFKADGRYTGQYSIRLCDGKIFRKLIDIPGDTPDDFFFLREGDTVVYSGKKIIEIRFQNEAQ